MDGNTDSKCMHIRDSFSREYSALERMNEIRGEISKTFPLIGPLISASVLVSELEDDQCT